MLKTEVQGEVLASRSCDWIKEWARQWELEVIHYRYERKSHLPPVDQNGQQAEGCLGEQQERLTRVEYTGKVLESDAHVDHTAVVAQAKQFIADCTPRGVTDASVARCVGCTIDEFGR